jgi:ketosteroid isomerase-like protein
MAQENVAIVERLIAALNERDVDQYLARCTPDFEYVSPLAPLEGIHRGEAGLRAVFSGFAEATTSFRVAVEQLRALDDDRVLALTRVTAVSQGGIPWEQPTASLYDFAGSKVRRIEIFLDRAEALEAVGLQE